MAQDRSELLQGTLELIVLKVLSLEPLHGWGISKRIQRLEAAGYVLLWMRALLRGTA